MADALKIPVNEILPDGTHNPEYYRQRIRDYETRHYQDVMDGKKPFDLRSAVSAVQAQAKLAGIDPKSLSDARSEGDKIRDAVNLLLEDPPAIREMKETELESVLKLIEERMDAADRLSSQVIEDRRGDMADDAERRDEEERRTKRGKQLMWRIRRVLRLKNRAKEAIPRYTQKPDRNGVEAAHVLRYMLYVGDAQTAKVEDTVDSVFHIGIHHARMVVTIWEARNGVEYVRGKVERGVNTYLGAIIVAPPGHSKSEIAMHLTSLEIGMRPRLQGHYLHAIDERAEEHVSYICNRFKPDNRAGRRHLSLFPAELASKKPGKGSFRIKLKAKLTAPTLSAAGVKASRLGANSNWQVLDDVVPQSDAVQETERDQRHKKLTGTWSSRQRGKAGTHFKLVIANMWHHDDAVARMIQSNKQTPLFKVCRLFVGGPKTTPPFKPIWPEIYPAAELRKRFAEMRDVRLWSAAYMAEPMAEESKIIKRLRFYDQASESHQRFLSSSVKHVSIDPSATNRQKSDKTGMAYAAHGDLPVSVGGGREVFERRLRFLDANEFHATQTELVAHVGGFSLTHPVDYVHVEVVSAFVGVIEMFKDKYGIDVNPLPTRNRSKELRLRSAAVVMDDASSDHGGARAIVEFPGVSLRNENGDPEIGKDGQPVIGPDPKYQWLYEQIEQFGACAADHTLDACTQLVNYLLSIGELPPSGGEFSQAVRVALRSGCDRRLEKMYDDADRELSGSGKPVEDEDWDFLHGRGVAWLN